MPAGPTGGVTSYTYDAAGQQLTETDPDGRVSVFGYDQLGRETSENDYSSQAEYDNDPDDPDETLTWTYNAAGQLASESDQIFYGSGSSSTISYTYDAFGRVASETQATSGAPTVEFDYTYDNNGNVLTETDTAAGALVETTTYSGYNGLNLPAMVVVATTAATLTIDYQYSSVGQTEQMTRYQDGELVDTTTYTYDGDGNLSEEKVVGPSGSTLEDFQYVYNGEGEIVTAITPTQGYVEYTYDAAGQLTSATYPNTPWANESYTYDAAGNRTSTTTGSTTDDTQQTAASTTTTGNELSSDGTFVYEYDADGNLIYQARISQAYSADDQTFYYYNNLNELVDVCTEDNGDTITQEVTYSYNAAGQRVSESVTVGQNTTTTNFVYDLSGNAVLSFDGSEAGDLTGQYVYGQAVDQLLAQTDSSGNVSWMITDRDESVRDVLQSSGGTTSVIDHIDYNSFGETITETAPSTPHLTGYAGYINDLAIGMLETDSRVYDASIGRFISQDPSGFSGSANGNLYEYTSNSPLSNVDPSGLMQQSPLAQVLSSIPIINVSSTSLTTDADGDGIDDDSGQSLVSMPTSQTGAPAGGGNGGQLIALDPQNSIATVTPPSLTPDLDDLFSPPATVSTAGIIQPTLQIANTNPFSGQVNVGAPFTWDDLAATEIAPSAVAGPASSPLGSLGAGLLDTMDPDPMGDGTTSLNIGGLASVGGIGAAGLLASDAPAASLLDSIDLSSLSAGTTSMNISAATMTGGPSDQFLSAALPAAATSFGAVVGGSIVIGVAAAFSPLIAGGLAIGGLSYWGYNLGYSAGQRTADGQTGTEAALGAIADNTPIGPLVQGTLNVDPGTWQPLNLTPSQQGAQFGAGGGGLLGMLTAPLAYNAAQGVTSSFLAPSSPLSATAGGPGPLMTPSGGQLQPGATLYRVIGGEADEFGASWTTVDPTVVPNYRAASGLYPGNSGQAVVTGTLLDTTGVRVVSPAVGPTTPEGALMVPEVLVPNPAMQIRYESITNVEPPF